MQLRRVRRPIRVLNASSSAMKGGSQSKQRLASDVLSTQPSVLAVIKPSGVPSLSETVKSSGYDEADVEDCVYNRLADYLLAGSSSSLGKSTPQLPSGKSITSATSDESTEATPTFFFPSFHDLPTQHRRKGKAVNWEPPFWSRGVQLAVRSPDDAEFFDRCAAVGVVTRTYLVLAHIPSCLTSSNLTSEQPGRPNARHGPVHTAAAPKITNPFVRRAMERKKEKEAEQHAASTSEQPTPSCVARDPSLSRLLVTGGSLKPQGSVNFSTVQESDSTDRIRQFKMVAKLFEAPTAATPTNPSPQSESVALTTAGGSGCCCSAAASAAGGGGSPRPVCCSGFKLDAPHPWMGPKERLTVTPNQAVIGAAQDGQIQRHAFQFKIMEKNDVLGLALYQVTTSSATEEAIRCAFAAAGMPLVGDWVYNRRFAAELQQRHLLETQNSGGATLAQKMGKSKKTDLSKLRINDSEKRSPLDLLKPAKETPNGDGATASSWPQQGLGLGISCLSVTFPDPDNAMNVTKLATLLPEVMKHRQRDARGSLTLAATAAGPLEVTSERAEQFRSYFGMVSLGLPSYAEHSFWRVIKSGGGNRGNTTAAALAGLTAAEEAAKALPPLPSSEPDEGLTDVLASVAATLDAKAMQATTADTPAVEVEATPAAVLPTVPTTTQEAKSVLLSLVDSPEGALMPGFRRNVLPGTGHSARVPAASAKASDTTVGVSSPYYKAKPLCQLCGGEHPTGYCTKGSSEDSDFSNARRNVTAVKEAEAKDPDGFFCIMCGEPGHWYFSCKGNPKHTWPVGQCPICREKKAEHNVVECPVRFRAPKGFLASGVHLRHAALVRPPQNYQPSQQQHGGGRGRGGGGGGGRGRGRGGGRGGRGGNSPSPSMRRERSSGPLYHEVSD